MHNNHPGCRPPRTLRIPDELLHAFQQHRGLPPQPPLAILARRTGLRHLFPHAFPLGYFFLALALGLLMSFPAGLSLFLVFLTDSSFLAESLGLLPLLPLLARTAFRPGGLRFRLRLGLVQQGLALGMQVEGRFRGGRLVVFFFCFLVVVVVVLVLVGVVVLGLVGGLLGVAQLVLANLCVALPDLGLVDQVLLDFLDWCGVSMRRGVVMGDVAGCCSGIPLRL